MAATPTTIQKVKQQADHSGLIRKTIHAAAFWAPIDTEVPETLTNEAGQLLSLPEAWRPFGLVATDGYTLGADTDKAEVEALGYVDPVRSDITKIARSIKFTCFETWQRLIRELVDGVNLAETTPNAGGELSYDAPQVPMFEEGRLMLVTTDGPAANEFIRGTCFTRVKLSEVPEEAFNNEDAESIELTFDAFPDAKLGTAMRRYFGGTGAKNSVKDLGWKTAGGAA
ncbi:hypothetical protein H8R18_01305 [Nanchangia anserum]|uniref:Uncharacterized protein n=1 Tax=Nanchangia anserum TaxID=2692125 RepID=A0A8I0KWC5_9ACTO|nr:hypothetical protein [Nanchangia anserum]MBD3689874.1 hypothetical protein [Nanchangia anserum]QOX82042.1 hypothetical protein H8R18_01305 [Nanchangia anserum]